jgi:hypothetical protein
MTVRIEECDNPEHGMKLHFDTKQDARDLIEYLHSLIAPDPCVEHAEGVGIMIIPAGYSFTLNLNC